MFVKKNIILIVLFLSGNILPIYGQENITENIRKNIARDGTNKTLKDLIEIVTFGQMANQWDGEYKRGNWDSVKTSKSPKFTYWCYPTGVTLYAMQRAYNILKKDTIINYVNKYNHIAANQYEYLRWQKYKFGTIFKTEGLGKLWRLNMLDDCGAMGTEILESVMHNNCKITPHLKELINIIGNYVTNIQSRLDDGTFWRPNSPNTPSIWADDLYMSLPFLIKWSEYKKDSTFLNDAVSQIINFSSYLQDKTDGIWFHGYYVKKKERTCCKWGRGNGWVAVAIAEVLSSLPETHPEYQKVKDIYLSQMKGLKKYQAEDGLWHQVLDHPELSFGTETSCSAQFTYAVARGINKGWLKKSEYIQVIDNAVRGLKTRISEQGGINKVCKSTSLGDNLEYYNTRPVRNNDYHGNGLMLLALTEVYQLTKNGVRK